MENRFDWALRNACLAIDALFWMDVHHQFAFVETFHGANHHAICVFATRARFSNDVRHRITFQKNIVVGD